MNDLAVQCIQLSKRFDDVQAVERFDLDVHQGEILAVIGPSGCGKTTLLRLIAGFERPDSGKVILGGQLVADEHHITPPELRGVGMVFQDYALFPHLTVFENVSFGLAALPKERRANRVSSMLKLVGLVRHADRFPHELSGGERQRVALARALSPQPILVLLDEPLSNLDADRRAQMREEVRAILKGIGATAIFVTHDQEEALFMGDRMAVIQLGRLEQIGLPEEIFHHPASRFVADFMGQTDFLHGIITPEGIMTEIGTLAQHVALPTGSTVEVALRPDDVSVQPDPVGKSLVLARHFKGAMNIYRLRLPSGTLVHALQPHTRIIKPGTPVHVQINAGHPLACFQDGKAIETRSLG